MLATLLDRLRASLSAFKLDRAVRVLLADMSFVGEMVLQAGESASRYRMTGAANIQPCQ